VILGTAYGKERVLKDMFSKLAIALENALPSAQPLVLMQATSVNVGGKVEPAAANDRARDTHTAPRPMFLELRCRGHL